MISVPLVFLCEWFTWWSRGPSPTSRKSVWNVLGLKKIDDRQTTHLICARLKYDLYDFFRGCFWASYTRKRKEAGPKRPLKKSYRSYFRRAQIRWVIWRSSKKVRLEKNADYSGREPFANPSSTLRQHRANPSPTLCQPFLPTPLQAPLSADPRRGLRNAGERLLGYCHHWDRLRPPNELKLLSSFRLFWGVFKSL